MSLDRDGSKLLENCLKMIGNPIFKELQQHLAEILKQLVTTPFEYLPDGFENRKIQNGRIFINDILVSKYGNYVIQTALDCMKSDPKLHHQFFKGTILKIWHTSQLLGKHKSDTLPIKHVLKHIRKLKIDINLTHQWHIEQQ